MQAERTDSLLRLRLHRSDKRVTRDQRRLSQGFKLLVYSEGFRFSLRYDESRGANELTAARPEPAWVALKDDELLKWRICDLGVRIPGSELEGRVAQLNEELAARGLAFRPGLLFGRRVVLAGRRSRHSDSVLSGASASENSGIAPNAGSGRRNSGVVPATVAA